MGHFTARVDTSRQIETADGTRRVPILVNGEKAVALFDQEAFEALADMVTTIQQKIPSFSYMSAVERATRRAVEDGLLDAGIVKIAPCHI